MTVIAPLSAISIRWTLSVSVRTDATNPSARPLRRFTYRHRGPVQFIALSNHLEPAPATDSQRSAVILPRVCRRQPRHDFLQLGNALLELLNLRVLFPFHPSPTFVPAPPALFVQPLDRRQRFHAAFVHHGDVFVIRAQVESRAGNPVPSVPDDARPAWIYSAIRSPAAPRPFPTLLAHPRP